MEETLMCPACGTEFAGEAPEKCYNCGSEISEVVAAVDGEANIPQYQDQPQPESEPIHLRVTDDGQAVDLSLVESLTNLEKGSIL